MPDRGEYIIVEAKRGKDGRQQSLAKTPEERDSEYRRITERERRTLQSPRVQAQIRADPWKNDGCGIPASLFQPDSQSTGFIGQRS